MKWHGFYCICMHLDWTLINYQKWSPKKKSARFKRLYKNQPVSKKCISKPPKVHIFLYHWVVQEVYMTCLYIISSCYIGCFSSPGALDSFFWVPKTKGKQFREGRNPIRASGPQSTILRLVDVMNFQTKSGAPQNPPVLTQENTTARTSCFPSSMKASSPCVWGWGRGQTSPSSTGFLHPCHGSKKV